MKKYQRDAVVGIERENERDETYRSKSNPQIDCERTPHNYHFIKPDDTYTAFINQRIKDLAPKRKIKDDAVLMCSFFVGASPEFFVGKDRDDIGAFFFECTEFFAERYGRENIISAVVHLDETTPHMHLNLMPVLDGRLCAKQLFDRKELRSIQTDLHNDVGKHGRVLKRGAQRADAHSEAGQGARALGSDDGGHCNGGAEADRRQYERQRGRGEHAHKDVAVLGAEDARGLDEGLVDVYDALVDSHAHDEEAGDGDDNDLGAAAHAGADDDQRHVGQRGDVADELNPGL